MFTPGELTLASIFCLLLGAFVGHWLNLGRDKRNRFFEASKEFRDVFIEIQRLLEINPPKDPTHPPAGFQNTIKLVEKFRTEHEAAVIRFNDYLPWHKRPCFTKRWHQYRCYNKESNGEAFSDYVPRPNEEEIANEDWRSLELKS